MPAPPRTLFFTAPLLEGDDVRRFQGLASKNSYGDFFDGKIDGVYGELSEVAARECRKWLGYPDTGANTWHNGVVGPRLIEFLSGAKPLPAAYAKRRKARLAARPKMVKPLPTPLGTNSEFTYVDAEGAPDNRGVRHHAGKDWFAPGGTRLVSPCDGKVVEVRPSRGSSGQVFGGTVKIQGPQYVHVFRHIEPATTLGARVKAGEKVAAVTRWNDWPSGSHAHCELWKTFAGGYNYENMVDPLPIYRAAA